MKKIDMVLGYVLAICLILFVVDYAFWLVATFALCMLLVGIAEGVKYIWFSLKSKRSDKQQ